MARGSRILRNGEHPPNSNTPWEENKKLIKWPGGWGVKCRMPEALDKQAQSDCHQTLDMMEQFRRQFGED